MRWMLLITLAAIGLTTCGAKSYAKAHQGNGSSNVSSNAPRRATAKSYPHEYIELDDPRNRVATVQQSSGIDTNHAILTAKVMTADAEEFCDRDPFRQTKKSGGSMTFEECVADVLDSDNATIYMPSADCNRKRLNSTIGKFRLIGKHCEDKKYCYNLWKNTRTGDTLEDDSASGLHLVDGQFEILCPRTSKNIPLAH